MTSEVSHNGEEQRSNAGEEPVSTGDPRVDRAVAGLADLETLPVSKHAARYDEVHAALHDILTVGEEVQR